MKSMFILFILWLTVSPLWAGQTLTNMYADYRAYQVGDILTVLISESSSGTHSASSTINKNDKLEMGVQGSDRLAFIPLMGAQSDTKNEHKSDGRNRRTNSLSGRMSVMIAAVEPNGLLTIEGTRTITIDGEKQEFSLSGTVRPEDIKSGNTISSHLIANARIRYQGKGDLAKVQKPGVLNRLFAWFF